MTGPVGVGFIGAGMISDQYLSNLTKFPDVEVVILGDIVVERAKSQAEKYGVAEFGTGEDVLKHPRVQVVVNLTLPQTHAEISSQALAAGKHVWSEKPIGLDRESTAALLKQADDAGLRLGIAPDTVLGPGVQTAKRAIDRGLIGTPLFATTQMQYQGPDLFHPNPSFLFAKGAGPLLDMGPYYFTALVNLFGSVKKVAALGLKGRETRTVKVGPDVGAEFPVEVPSTIQVLTAFEAGQQSQSLLSNDSSLFRQGIFEVYGTEGTLIVPDPNMFEGTITLIKPIPGMDGDGKPQEQETIELELEGVVTGRGLGLLDMVRAIAEGRDHRANGKVGYHVLDVMLSAEESAAQGGAFLDIESSVDAIPTMPLDFDPFAQTL
ncbi:Gfo/Idh/MocA family protein [Microbacterium indicum]|uniref:Gfo/Idh/MocA family protein n=1 Tax=Microbacterium indicum TaxID=358100 RepID=UPI000401D4F4|nr:Gfo/Idh/MocA family oxidoreductase [Microbacterium indicum]